MSRRKSGGKSVSTLQLLTVAGEIQDLERVAGDTTRSTPERLKAVEKLKKLSDSEFVPLTERIDAIDALGRLSQ